MASLGPFERFPALAVAVSGGADSLALALCARGWAAERGGTVLALVVDHGLRPDSAGEAAETLARLWEIGAAARAMRLCLMPGPGLAARARAARYDALMGACAEAGILHLLLGHHAADQAETVLLRAVAASAPAGLAGMAAVRELGPVRLLRPLLGVPPGRLRASLRQAGLGWVEDPSNRDPAATRARLRAWLADPEGDGRATRALVAAAAAAGSERATSERDAATRLAVLAAIRPEGFAVLRPGPVEPAALSALIQAVGGRPYPPASRQVAALAGAPRPATLGGVRLSAAGRLGPGWLVTREAAAMASPVPAGEAVWDGRFRLAHGGGRCDGLMLGPLGADSAGLRRRLAAARALPAIVLRTLPALRRGAELVAVPHLDARFEVLFCPPRPAASAAFLPA